MRPIFLIYTFNDPEHLKELVASLSPYPVLVHVDGKVSIRPFEDALNESGHARLIEERVQVNWGGYSQVRAIRALVGEALTLAADDDYLIMLSGSDFPIRPIPDLVRFLSERQGTQFLRAFDVSTSERKYTYQVDRQHHRDLRLLSRQTHRPLLRKIRNALIKLIDSTWSPVFGRLKNPPVRVAHGGTHFAMTAECVRELESLVTPAVEDYFSKVFVPEEKFYHSLLQESRFRGRAPAGGLEPYAGPGNWRYSNLHLIDPSLIKVFTLADWDEVRTSQKFFLRKVDSYAGAGLRDRIKVELLGEGNPRGNEKEVR